MNELLDELLDFVSEHTLDMIAADCDQSRKVFSNELLRKLEYAVLRKNSPDLAYQFAKLVPYCDIQRLQSVVMYGDDIYTMNDFYMLEGCNKKEMRTAIVNHHWSQSSDHYDVYYYICVDIIKERDYKELIQEDEAWLPLIEKMACD